MTTITTAETISDRRRWDTGLAGTPTGGTWWSALATLTRRRLALSARTPRELTVPLLTPVLFALVVAPALADTLGGSLNGIDYMTFVAVSTIGFLIPFSCMSSGLGVIVDRISGARRDLLAAPLRRPLIVLANIVVATLLSSLQVAVLVGFAALRGGEFDWHVTGIAWFVATAVVFAVAMYSVSEILANRIATQEEYVNTIGAVAFTPWFFAGSLFPISAMPAGVTVLAKVLPLTHVLALLRYSSLDRSGAGLYDIWGMSNPTSMAALSLAVVVAFAVAATAISIRVFKRTAVR
jgi:lipooligosaccharide transport system permease protein